MWREFKSFILRGNVVDLAVAVVVGAAFGAVVTAFVRDFLTPIIGAVGGTSRFSSLSFTIHNSTFMYGDFINNALSFLIIATVVFFFVVYPLSALKSRLTSRRKTVPDTKKCPECLSDIPAEAKRCKYCTTRFDSG